MIATATARDTRENGQGGIWDYVSASRLSLWARCPLAFKIKYIDGVRTAPSLSMFLGKQVHAGLEVFNRHRQLRIDLEPAEVVGRLQASWDKAVIDEGITFKEVEQETRLWQQTADLVAAYIEQVSADEPRPLAVEASLQVPLVDPVSGEDLGIPLVGIVDLILPGNRGPVIIDFKTAARGGELLEISHELQLTAYAYAYRQLTGVEESALQIRRLVKTKTPRVETFSFPARSDRHFARFFALLRAYLDDLRLGRFVYRPGWSCSMCDYRNTHCQQWAG